VNKKNIISRLWLSIAGLIAITGILSAQPEAPYLLCADVQADGTVVLTWDIPSNVQPTHFYRIYRDNGAGFVEIVNNLPNTNTTYSDQTINAQTTSVKYRMQTHGAESSTPGNTVSTLFLNILPSGSSIAHLSWNSPYSETPLTGLYNIYRSVEGGMYNQIASISTQSATYVDTLFGLCDLVDLNKQFIVNYKVSYERAECEMFSQPVEGEFRDNLGPGLVEVETATINPLTGFPELYWYPITGAPDLKDYAIRAIIDGSESTVGIVPAFENTSFVFIDADLDEATTFQIIAHDSCDVESGYENQYTTIRASSSYTDCSQTLNLKWTLYTGWQEGIALHNIYVNQDNGGFQLVESLAANAVSYDMPIDPNSEYCMYVEAVSNGSQRPSTTNATCVQTNYPEVAAFNYLNRVTTIDNKRIQIDLLQDLDANGTRYELFKSKNNEPFQSFGVYEKTESSILTVVDTDVDADFAVYQYKWKAFDGCGLELGESNVGKNIVLNVLTSSSNLVNSLTWTNYGDWDGGVEEYRVLRKLGSETDFSLFATVNSHSLQFEEDVEAYILEEGEFCYKIVGVEGSNQYDSQTVSESNIGCATQEPLMWIPNTIVLNGKNNVFAPVAGFIDFQSYEMEVYNKWGERIFVSHDIQDGWDGTYRGNFVPQDYYRYIIIYRDGSGKSYLKQGAIYVVTTS